MKHGNVSKFEVGKEVAIDPEEFFGIKIVECDPATAIVDHIDVEKGIITIVSQPSLNPSQGNTDPMA